MFGVSGEHLLILVFILLIFGPRRLPEVGAKAGKAVKNFKDAYNGIREPRYRRLRDLPAKDAEKSQANSSKNSPENSPPS